MSSKIVVFHYYPIEGYPPVQNLLNLKRFQEKVSLTCMTTKGNHNYNYKNPYIKIIYLGNSDATGKFKSLKRYFSYLLFNIVGFISLLYKRPSSIIYYETISAFPALLYKYIFPSTQLYVLYHEYTSKEEYLKGPSLVRMIHKLEIKSYEKVNWISHTNTDRRKLFSKDYDISIDKISCLPNYPPSSWLSSTKNLIKTKNKCKFVYVGYTIDNYSMYIDEMVNVISGNSDFSLDFYLLKTPSNIVKEIHAKGLSNRIQFKSGLAYNDLPLILGHYDVGIILYRGLTKNYIYNAPNKLFEYLACGLSVWYPKVMLGITPYKSTRIREVDFDSSDILRLNVSDYCEGDTINYDNFTAEKAFKDLMDRLIG
ncbi:glycosyltransferase family protein [Winogradskyella costae]|uniref:hypothetical protein n=1 Tax=Winogradskyella costae TaxID=2697008 RepID=UPI0015CD4FDF|nr:hypothetical protein [Winogradskyella costae]